MVIKNKTIWFCASFLPITLINIVKINPSKNPPVGPIITDIPKLNPLKTGTPIIPKSK